MYGRYTFYCINLTYAIESNIILIIYFKELPVKTNIININNFFLNFL